MSPIPTEIVGGDRPGRERQRTMTAVRLLRWCAVVTVAALSGPREARSACNVIPQAERAFRGDLGSTNRPFAGPGEFVQVRLQPTGCDVGSAGFTSTAAADYAV